MSLTTALATLAAVTVAGVTKSFTLATMRGGVQSADLPALLPLPGTGQNERAAYGTNSESFFEYHTVRHRLLVAPVASAPPFQGYPDTVTLIDAYHEAIEELATHAGAIDISVERYESGEVTWGGVLYYGADFFVRIWIND